MSVASTVKRENDKIQKTKIYNGREIFLAMQENKMKEKTKTEQYHFESTFLWAFINQHNL